VTCFDSIEGFPERVDALFIVHQDILPGRISSLVEEKRFKTLIVVSSHAPFPDEFETFRKAASPTQVWWTPMSRLLTDSEMERCDERAVSELGREGRRMDVGPFLRRSRYLRNEAACRNLAGKVGWSHCFSANGLGIVPEAWTDSVSFGLPIPLKKKDGLRGWAWLADWFKHPPASRRKTWLSRFAYRVFHRPGSHGIEIVEDGRECFVFLDGATRRLRFRQGVRLHRWEGAGRRFSTESDTMVLCRLAKKALWTFRDQNARVASTVHGFAPWMLEQFPEVRVFVDGLHPPNYPVSYGAAYRGATIVSREDCDRSWFEKCGCKVLPPATILAPEHPYGNPRIVPPFRTVCLMLNHAGDWSALIDRSDTDLAVMEFASTAERLPGLKFRIRAHPTMTLPEHEGTNSYIRLQDYVGKSGLKNLEFSQGTLDEDISWCDICVSEYSNVLVDCLKNDMMCIALNPTNRRNFLEHLAPLGLQTVKNGYELSSVLGCGTVSNSGSEV